MLHVTGPLSEQTVSLPVGVWWPLQINIIAPNSTDACLHFTSSWLQNLINLTKKQNSTSLKLDSLVRVCRQSIAEDTTRYHLVLRSTNTIQGRTPFKAGHVQQTPSPRRSLCAEAGNDVAVDPVLAGVPLGVLRSGPWKAHVGTPDVVVTCAMPESFALASYCME